MVHLEVGCIAGHCRAAEVAFYGTEVSHADLDCSRLLGSLSTMGFSRSGTDMFIHCSGFGSEEEWADSDQQPTLMFRDTQQAGKWDSVMQCGVLLLQGEEVTGCWGLGWGGGGHTQRPILLSLGLEAQNGDNRKKGNLFENFGRCVFRTPE